MFNFFKKQKINQDTLALIEEELIISDIGISTTNKIIENIKKHKFNQDVELPKLKNFIATSLAETFNQYNSTLEINQNPFVILVVGTNGSGKTTTIAKLAAHLQQKQLKVLLAAGDTFRAGATEQLVKWGNTLNIPVFSSIEAKTTDPAALIYQAAQKAKAENFEVLIADTSGRFSNNSNLMLELQKIEKVLKKIDPSYPHQSILVLDGTLGQSSLHIAEGFIKTISISSLIITKLDGSSKGGALVPITEKLKIPTLFLGLGEKVTDLTPFSPEIFTKKVLGL